VEAVEEAGVVRVEEGEALGVGEEVVEAVL